MLIAIVAFVQVRDKPITKMNNPYIPGNFSEYGIPFTTDGKYTVKERVDLLELLPGNFSPHSILEVGCANGKNLRFFSNRFKLPREHTFGVDICKSIENDYTSFNFINDSAEEYFEACNRMFDLIIFSDVLEHTYNPWDLLKRAKHNLSPAGVMLISVPNLQNLNYIDSVLSGEFYYQQTGLFDETHIRFFTQRSINYYLNTCGYRPLKFGWRPDLSLENLRGNVLQTLAASSTCAVALANSSITVTKENLDSFFGQQILISLSHA